MRRTLKISLYVILICVAIALASSAIVLYSLQFVAEPSAAVISLGDFEVTASGLHAEPFWNVVAAWLIVAGGLLVAGVAIVFALIIALLAVAFAMFLVMGAVGLLASPLIVIGLIVWLAVRSSRNAPPPLPPAMPNATP